MIGQKLGENLGISVVADNSGGGNGAIGMEAAAKAAADGGDVVGDAPEQFGQFLRADVARWSKIVKLIGLRLE